MWFFKKTKRTEQDILIDRIKAERLDMQGLFSNINKRGEVEALYKELSKLSHPDKFEKNPEKKEIAQKLFIQIQSNRNNYTQLMELKAIAEVKLLND
ncbi:MAG: hypothetical protein J5965_16780 [Aeriscardovia sp.]|nr:hypothetical protein [Aeriscardovia sp.]